MDSSKQQPENYQRLPTAKEWLDSQFLSQQDLRVFFENFCDNTIDSLRKTGLKTITIKRVKKYYVQDVFEFLISKRDNSPS